MIQKLLVYTQINIYIRIHFAFALSLKIQINYLLK